MADILPPLLARHGFPAVQTVRLHKPVAGDKTLEEQCLRLGTLPSRAYGQGTCALRWKIEPQDLFLRRTYPQETARITALKNALQPGARRSLAEALRAVGHDSAQGALDEIRELRFLKALGYDGGEERRAKIHEDAYCRLWFPLMEFGMDRAACLAIIDRHGLPRPPKSACFFCPSSRKSEVLALADEHPDLFTRAVAMERSARDSEKSTAVVGLGRHWSWEELVRLDPARRARVPEQPVEPCVMCADGDDD